MAEDVALLALRWSRCSWCFLSRQSVAGVDLMYFSRVLAARQGRCRHQQFPISPFRQRRFFGASWDSSLSMEVYFPHSEA